MSASIPASLNALVSSGRSAPSQRAEDAVPGRTPPTLCLAAGVLVPPPPLPELELSSLPHAATLNASAADTVHATRARCFMDLPFLRVAQDGDNLRIRSIRDQMPRCQEAVARAPLPSTSATAPSTSARSA